MKKKIKIWQIESFVADLTEVKDLNKIIRILTVARFNFSVTGNKLIVPITSEYQSHMEIVRGAFYLHCNKFQVEVNAT